MSEDNSLIRVENLRLVIILHLLHFFLLLLLIEHFFSGFSLDFDSQMLIEQCFKENKKVKI
jgi:hypothetical protein